MIRLYQLPGCPYCARVSDKLDELDLEYEEVNIERDDKPKIVMDNGGLVPVIDDDGMVMNESADILEYLENKYNR